MIQEHKKLYESHAEAQACAAVVEPVLQQRCLRDLRTWCDDRGIDFDKCAVTMNAARVDGCEVVVYASITKG